MRHDLIYRLNRWLSYLFPIRLAQYDSALSGPVEVNLVEGRQVLDTATSNYSYGPLQQVLARGLREVPVASRQSVLVLGMGGGSVIETLREAFLCTAYIEAVEVDPIMVRLAQEVFKLDRFEGVHIIEADAAAHIHAGTSRFDLILVDIFVIDRIPEVFTAPDFLQGLVRRLNPGGYILYNTIRSTLDRKVFRAIQAVWTEAGLSVQVLENVSGTNDLLIATAPHVSA
ncbi:MAG: fused MFS/spermidine synthase [Bacteroidia bacterium]|nr:fused MFS/spermidine synthase [Bacteroidia bacterium]